MGTGPSGSLLETPLEKGDPNESDLAFNVEDAVQLSNICVCAQPL